MIYNNIRTPTVRVFRKHNTTTGMYALRDVFERRTHKTAKRRKREGFTVHRSLTIQCSSVLGSRDPASDQRLLLVIIITHRVIATMVDPTPVFNEKL